MRGEVDPQSSMFHYFSVESRIPTDHPLRRVKKLAESALSAISAELDGLYARTGRPSIPPERLLRRQDGGGTTLTFIFPGAVSLFRHRP